MATTWLLVLMTAGAFRAPVAVSDGGYKSEALCTKTATQAVEQLNRNEVALEKASTTVSDGGRTTVVAYGARTWAYQCIPTDKG